MIFRPTAHNHLINELRRNGATVTIDPVNHTITAHRIMGNDTVFQQATFASPMPTIATIQQVYRQFMAALAVGHEVTE